MKTVFAALLIAISAAAQDYLICVSNEKAGTISFMDPSRKTLRRFRWANVRAGFKHVRTANIYLWRSAARAIKGPPTLDAQGNPIFEADNDDDKNSDHSADGIAIVDVAQRRFVRKISAGSDPEQFAVSAGGKHICVSNEDIGNRPDIPASGFFAQGAARAFYVSERSAPQGERSPHRATTSAAICAISRSPEFVECS